MQIIGTVLAIFSNLVVFILLRMKLTSYIKVVVLGVAITGFGLLFTFIAKNFPHYEILGIVVFYSLSILMISYMLDILKAVKMQFSKRYSNSFGSPFSNKYILFISLFIISIVQFYLLWLK